MVNKNVLEKAPCSVAILVHDGRLFDSSFNSRSGAMKLASQNESCYNAAILFLGAADDREALELGARMAAHPNIKLTSVRLLVDGSIINTSEDVEENRLDSDVLSGFREGMADNYRAMYIEELLMDGSGTMAVIRSMENNYELVIAGRNKDTRTPFLSGFMDENEQSELGAIRKVLATAYFMSKSRILVVQQHTKVVNDNNENHREKIREQSMTIDDVEDLQIQRR